MSDRQNYGIMQHMRIRTRLMMFSFLFTIGALMFTVLGIATIKRINAINNAITKGVELQVSSRDVHSLMKDMVFDIFVPKVYGQLKSFTYSPRTNVTVREWRNSVKVYENAFSEFMQTKDLLDIKSAELLDQYATASTMHQHVLKRLGDLNESIEMLTDIYGSLDEKRFDKIMSDDTFIPFFEEFRDTSYYFVDSFESFMNHFIKKFGIYADKLEYEIYIIYGLLTCFITSLGVTLSLIFSKDIIGKIDKVKAAFARISKGDFSVHMDMKGSDEFAELAENFNVLALDLKDNVETILSLTQAIGESLSEDTDLAELFYVVVHSVVQETAVDSAFIHMLGTDLGKPGNTVLKLCAQDGAVDDIDIGSIQKDLEEVVQTAEQHMFNQNELFGRLKELSSLIVMPLILNKEAVGTLTVAIHSPNPSFTDLGFTRLSIFAEFASLTMDNHIKYSELITKGEAEYQALQSQVQPHFINNILNGFIGLNRMGEKQGLEKSIIYLKEMLQYTQDSRRDTTISEEMSFVENYCLLQKLRFGERLMYTIKMQPDLKTVNIPRLLLQPLVENAVIHGIEDLQDRVSLLEVEAFSTLKDGKKMVTIVVRDNGLGFDIETLQEKEHIGIGNVRKRFKYAFPHSAFYIKSTPGKGTEIRITFHDMYHCR